MMSEANYFFQICYGSNIVKPFFLNLINFKIILVSAKLGKKLKNRPPAVEFKLQCPALGTILIYKETEPKEEHWILKSN